MNEDDEKNESLRIDTSLILLLSRLRALGIHEESRSVTQNLIELPCICVVGNQSSGKSTLLTELVGFKFPTGGGKAVTKCPIECHASKGNQEYLKVTHGSETLHDGTFLDSESLYNLIKSKTMSGFDTTPVIIKQIGPNCHDFSVVDLPGLTADKMEKQQVEQMYSKYIKSDHNIICVVNQASVDLKTNDALTYSSVVDKENARTVLVFTKVDEFNSPVLIQKIVDKGGYAIRCRTRSNEDLGALEREIFGKDIWADFPLQFQGVSKLRVHLQQKLTVKIKEQLPKLIVQFSEEKRKKESILEKYKSRAYSESEIYLEVGMLIRSFGCQIKDFCAGSCKVNILRLFQFLDNHELAQRKANDVVLNVLDLKDFEELCEKFPGKAFKFMGNEQIHLNCVKQYIDVIRPALIDSILKLCDELTEVYTEFFRNNDTFDSRVLPEMSRKLNTFIEITKDVILLELERKLSFEGSYLTYKTSQIKDVTIARQKSGSTKNMMYEYLTSYIETLTSRLLEYLESVTKQYYLKEFPNAFQKFCQEKVGGRQMFIQNLVDLLTPSEDTKKDLELLEFQSSQLSIGLKLLRTPMM